ncbi:MAG: hypothetical protein KDK70_29870 [Myxococcales bacterium]|nr:hypothetical protein [Myxococcales bacterium]
MNVYLLTNLISGARALVFARVEHEARYRRPDGAQWRLGRWHEPGGHRIAPELEWWPGTPDDIGVDPVMRGIDADSEGLSCSPVMATKSGRRPASARPSTLGRRPPSPERALRAPHASQSSPGWPSCRE